VLLAADVVVSPVQRLINNRFLTEARRKLTEVDPVVIGVTGSYGKTSTKVAIQKILGGKGEAFATPASFNTPLGVARSINESLTDAHRYFVVEMGARQEGDVAEIVSLVGPSIGVLTAIGPAHLESFGSMDAIRRGKYEIIEGLPTNGVAVMNVDDLEVRTLADQSVGKVSRVLRYGVGEAGRPSVTATDIKVHQRGTDFTIVEVGSGHRIPVSTKLLGTHAIGHVLAGVAVALALGIELSEVAARIDGLEPVEHRLQIIEGAGGVTVIDDAYNSNPAGANAALEVLASMPARRRVVITPGMVELGAEQAAANETFGRRAASVADAVIFVAKVNRAALVAGGEAAAHAQVIVVDSLSEASARLPDLIGPGDVVLFENDLPDHHET
jgi:UDP-N-acetylmuramoyl-tripeptide--D-alanyl-D-alanine ligase